MPVTEESVLHIVCDNPDCPGNDLDPADRTGWTSVAVTVYGEMATEKIFCSSGCIARFSTAVAADELVWAEIQPMEIPPVGEPA